MLTRAALILSSLWIFVALAAGIVMQLELTSPGIQVYREGDVAIPQFHGEFRLIHYIVSLTAVPVTALGALGCFKLADHRSPGHPLAIGERAAGIVLLIIAGGFAMVGILYARQISGQAPHLTSFADAASTVSLLAGVLAAIRTRTSRRATAPWLVFAVALSLIAAVLFAIGQQATDIQHQDTYWRVAIFHAVGGAGWLLILGLLSALSAENHRPAARWLSVLLAGLITLAWTGMVISQAQLGLAGMPRGYADYPEAFTVWQVRAGVCGAVAVAMSAFVVLRLVLLQRAAPFETQASVF